MKTVSLVVAFFLALFLLSIFVSGCKNDTPEQEIVKKVPSNFKLISEEVTEFGKLFEYSCGNDTIIIAKGKSSSVSITNKYK
jgi:hypothetical protein